MLHDDDNVIHMIQTDYCTTEIGAERPIHRCGNPMVKNKSMNGKQSWRCVRISCFTPQRIERDHEHRERRRERDRKRYTTEQEYRERKKDDSRAQYRKKSNERTLEWMAERIDYFERRLPRKITALIRMAADTRDSANTNERSLAYEALRREGYLK